MLGESCSLKLKELLDSLSLEDAKIVNDAFTKAYNNSGVKEKGVNVVKASIDNHNEIKNKILNDMPSFIKRLFPAYAEASAWEQASMASEGLNAFFVKKANEIILPKNNKLCLTSFHELGHSMNKNMSKIGKLLLKSRNLSLLALPIMAITLCKTKKQKVKNLITLSAKQQIL